MRIERFLACSGITSVPVQWHHQCLCAVASSVSLSTTLSTPQWGKADLWAESALDTESMVSPDGSQLGDGSDSAMCVQNRDDACCTCIFGIPIVSSPLLSLVTVRNQVRMRSSQDFLAHYTHQVSTIT